MLYMLFQYFSGLYEFYQGEVRPLSLMPMVIFEMGL